MNLYSWMTVFALLLTGCSRERQSNRTEIIRVAVVGEVNFPANFAPETSSERHVNNAISEGLLALSADGKLQPRIASSWSHSADATEWTFTIRPEAKWSDGTMIVPDDFIRTLHLLLGQKLTAPSIEMLFCIAGARDYYNHPKDHEPKLGASADGKLLIYRLAGPDPTFDRKLMHAIWRPTPPVQTVASHALTRVPTPCSGPFSVDRVTTGRVMLKPNPYYWQVSHTGVALEFWTIERSKTQEDELRSGRLDVATSLAPGYPRRLRSDPVVRSLTKPAIALYFLICNTRDPALATRESRVALSRQINRSAIANVVMDGTVIATDHIIPSGLLQNTSKSIIEEDVPEPTPIEYKLMPRLTYSYPADTIHQTIAETLHQNWRSVAPNVILESRDRASHLAAVAAGDFQIARAGWAWSSLDAMEFLQQWESGAPQNYAGWSSKAYDDFLAAARLEGNTDKRDSLLSEAEKILISERPIIPIFFSTAGVLYRGRPPALNALNEIDFTSYLN